MHEDMQFESFVFLTQGSTLGFFLPKKTVGKSKGKKKFKKFTWSEKIENYGKFVVGQNIYIFFCFWKRMIVFELYAHKLIPFLRIVSQYCILNTYQTFSILYVQKTCII